MDSNFNFLSAQFPDLEKLGVLAEYYLYTDPDSSIIKMGKLAELMVKAMLAMDGITWSQREEDTHASRIRLLKQNDMLPRQIDEILYTIRKERNLSAHDREATTETCKKLLQMTHNLCSWFMEIYGDFSYVPSKFHMPKQQVNEVSTLEQEHQALMAKYEQLSQAFEKSKVSIPDTAIPVALSERKKRMATITSRFKMSEAETRLLIDAQLNAVGWEADTENLRYSKGTRPQKGKNLAIAEWPTSSSTAVSGAADYALFMGLELVGIIEAKAIHQNIASVIDNQCAEYSKNILSAHQKYLLPSVVQSPFKVPFLFATNGQKYQKQWEIKSGVWFRDARSDQNIPKPLQDFISPEGIRKLLDTDIQSANASLHDTPYDLLEDKEGLNLRKYQLAAIEHVEAAVIAGQREILLAMATGTGKTRTILGMIYRFLKAERFKRILFLVDRTSLGEQAQDVFSEVKLEQLMTLDEIYNIKNLEDKSIDRETKIHVSTIQGMVRRVHAPKSDDKNRPNVSDYDLIIIDEAHRGYTLDKEMSDDEQEYLDQDDFKSKYREVIEFFDAVKVALTATPALHTTEIFGKPVYEYTYRQAVIDDYLVDHNVPHVITTKLADTGIHYEKGDTVTQYDQLTGEIINTAELPDELHFDIESFNRKIVNDNNTKVVLEEIFKDIDPENEQDGKVLIFAVNDNHADTIVNILKNHYAPMGVPNNAIAKITSSIGGGDSKKVQQAIKNYKNEKYPSIAVTVDLLSTGIDVPEITTLVFMRRIKSRILFEQMLGRATRLCDKIQKTHFEIYDPVGVYESLQPVSTMKPMVQSVTKSFSDLISGIEVSQDDLAKVKVQVDNLKTKLQRKLRGMSNEDKSHFESLAGSDPQSFVDNLYNLSPAELFAKEELFVYLDNLKTYNPNNIVISDHEDEVISRTRGYGKGKSPEDYLEEFRAFIEENLNKITALNLVCTKPSDLTRAELRDLRLLLDRADFKESHLNTAWNDSTNEAITSDIIAFIRRMALGSPLMSTEERIKRGVNKLRAKHDFNKMQQKFIDRIEKSLLNELVIDRESFDSGQFKTDGGFNRIDKIFTGKLESYIDELNGYLYEFPTQEGA